ncbi:Uncharacterised protein [Mycobacteroides abscessus subsp. abscessus]|nr:Uncharacterised protein [Mycobacteroides abscessus subsp. abscessus]
MAECTPSAPMTRSKRPVAPEVKPTVTPASSGRSVSIDSP